jgi:threonine dehydratase
VGLLWKKGIKSMNEKDIQREALEAEERIRPYIRNTPVEFSSHLSNWGNCKVYLKLENIQLSGSFKFRGVINKLLSLSQEERGKGVVTASSGNHGCAFAHACHILDLKGTVFLPSYASPAKIDAISQYAVDIQFYGDDCGRETEVYARHIAEETGQVYISPYNDPKVIGGQGTIGIELEHQLDSIHSVFVCVGGGGLIGGIAGYLKANDRNIEILGCQPKNSAVMYESVKAGQIIEMESLPTLSDGSAGCLEPGAITFEICRDYVDNYILVSEDEIKDAILFILEKHHMIIEGAAAVAVAAFLKKQKQLSGQNVVIVISGAKISLDTLKKILVSG